MELIVVRHGLTEANKNGIIGTDSNLTEEGNQQALEIAEKLKDENIDVIYCSPLKRTSQTALPLAEKLKKEIYIDNRIREIDWGDFDGKDDAYFIKETGIEPRHNLDSYKYDFSPYNGENAANVEKRIRSFVNDLKTKSYKKVLVVSHGGILRMLNYVIAGEKIEYQKNGQILRYKI